MLAFLRRPLRSAAKVTFCFNFAQVKASDSGAFSWQEPQKIILVFDGPIKSFFYNFFWVWKKVCTYLPLNLQAVPWAINRKVVQWMVILPLWKGVLKHAENDSCSGHTRGRNHMSAHGLAALGSLLVQMSWPGTTANTQVLGFFFRFLVVVIAVVDTVLLFLLALISVDDVVGFF